MHTCMDIVNCQTTMCYIQVFELLTHRQSLQGCRLNHRRHHLRRFLPKEHSRPSSVSLTGPGMVLPFSCCSATFKVYMVSIVHYKKASQINVIVYYHKHHINEFF